MSRGTTSGVSVQRVTLLSEVTCSSRVVLGIIEGVVFLYPRLQNWRHSCDRVVVASRRGRWWYGGGLGGQATARHLPFILAISWGIVTAGAAI